MSATQPLDFLQTWYNVNSARKSVCCANAFGNEVSRKKKNKRREVTFVFLARSTSKPSA